MIVSTRVKKCNISEIQKHSTWVFYRRLKYSVGVVIEEKTYKTWLYSMSCNPLMGEDITELKTFLSHNQRYPFIPPLLTKITKQAYEPIK